MHLLLNPIKSPVTIKINNLQSSKEISSVSLGNELKSFNKIKLFNIVFHAQINNFCSLNSKSSDNIIGYVFLHLDQNGKWWLNTLNCIQVSDDQVLIEDENERIYYVPSDNLENNSSGFQLIE